MPYLTDMYHEQNRGRAAESGFDPGLLTRQLQERVIGQDRAIEVVVRALVLARVGAHDPGRPLANLLLVGPTGVGKTELVRQVAAHVRAGPDDLCRVDMNALAQEHYAASFNGAPPGYAGSKEAFTLFDPTTVEGDPYTPGIVLFDEVEKAHPSVLRALLHVLDSGTLRLASGQRTISFRNTLVFLTSNLGSKELARRRGARWRRVLDRVPATTRLAAMHGDSVVEDAVRGFFDVEFQNRIDETVVFTELSRDAFTRIAALEVQLLVARLRRRGVTLTVTPLVVTMLAERGFDPVFGARALRRCSRELLATPVAEALVSTGAKEVHADVDAATGRVQVCTTADRPTASGTGQPPALT